LTLLDLTKQFEASINQSVKTWIYVASLKQKYTEVQVWQTPVSAFMLLVWTMWASSR